MAIDALQLVFHLSCFRCSRCDVSLTTRDAKGCDVHVRDKQLLCHRCQHVEDEPLTSRV